METLQSLDLDGLDGILLPSAKRRSGSFSSKAILAALFIALATIILLFLVKHPPLPLISPETATQPQAKAVAEASKNVPQTEAAQTPVKDEQITPAADTSSMPRAGTANAGRQNSAAQPAMVQVQLDAPMLPTEPTAAGNATGTAGGAPLTVYFKFKSSTPIQLSEAETSRLMAVAKGCPKHVRITGHTCHLGNVHANLRLGQRRADAVKKWLVAGGIDAKRIETASEGENTPVTSNATAAELAVNRRAVLDCVDQ